MEELSNMSQFSDYRIVCERGKIFVYYANSINW